ncbi:DUF1801 domain-containing protein [Burkholderia lata]|uniref:YdhG-like domain-containing protein n=1 Tax=Burkholderia lata (strain ATCC 17760 / DSM 23089 / LMG 22485 / NCIMB 9086 / R18194 / 383) TaxID=482957 RepID=A0A6P2RHW2_BURL3|nr:DUF1801 domain-containing protein [Burkholderia lata]VWC32750.1 hypothetical protein BLA15945_06545 [Burkholderia lata]
MSTMDLTPSERIDALIAGIDDWRGKTFADLRQTILDAQAGIVEEWKWMGSPVWSCDGMIAVANAHKGKVKLTFMHGAQLPDPDRLFNDGLDGNARRTIDLFEGDRLDKRALKNLVRAAIDYNRTHLKKNTRRAGAGTKARADKAA